MRPIKLKIVAFQSNGIYPMSEKGKAERRKKKVITRLLTLIGLLFTIILLVKIIFGERGFISLMKIRSEYVSILEEVEALDNENTRLKEEINRLNNDKYYQEKLAREKLGYIKEGEVVFLFPDEEEKEPFSKEGGDMDNEGDSSPEAESN